MLIPLVADMLAAQQVSGMASAPTAHYFCTFCDLDFDDIDILDHNEWPEKDVEHIHHYASLWKNATNEKEWKTLFEATGLRWSPLLRLPYWNPALYTVVDSMHALDLNLIQIHCHQLFQIDVEVMGGDGTTNAPHQDKRAHYSKVDKRSFDECLQHICDNRPDLFNELMNIHRRVLFAVCDHYKILGNRHCLVIRTRSVLARNIQEWRNSNIQDVLAFLSSDAHVLQNEEIGVTDINLQQCTAKQNLYDAIIESINDSSEKFERLSSFIPQQPSSRVVLGKDLMEAIWDGMCHTRLPGWIHPIPHNWGTVKRGKLSSDNWRVIGTIHLPITLIWKWRNETGRKQLLLQNFMNLVSAVNIANLCSTSRWKAAKYRELMTSYVLGMKELFPDQRLWPVHHMAIHIGDILDLFGPVHAYSSPYYECYINFFHHINTNQKIGELETTFMRTAVRAANIHAVLADDNTLRENVFELIKTMDAIEKKDIRGFRQATLLDPTKLTTFTNSKGSGHKFTLDAGNYQLLVDLLDHQSAPPRRPPAKVFCLDEVSYRGVLYGASGSHGDQNSNIYFCSPQGVRSGSELTHSQEAETIERIFRISDTSHDGILDDSVFLVVREYPRLTVIMNARIQDPYFKYGQFARYLCEASLTITRVIRLTHVVSHVTLTAMSEDYEHLLHVLPVDHLMLTFHDDDGDQGSN
ncbi:hypothetical protein BDQ17DRAFT_1333955 [Cyathus striatus]|nr:hypothetical protein BDQ17DRAFT_1333955 [Cyathus striatus]